MYSIIIYYKRFKPKDYVRNLYLMRIYFGEFLCNNKLEHCQFNFKIKMLNFTCYKIVENHARGMADTSKIIR